MTVDANRVSDALPDDIRVPLHELQADMDYLFGRAAADSSTAGAMSQSVKAKLTALETALTEALRRSPSLSGGEVERFEPFANEDDGEFMGMGAVPDGEWVRYADHIAALASPSPLEGVTHQERVAAWMQECFGPAITADKVERADRFIEEALELAQATGWTADRGHALVDYVFARPVGELGQEVGGVMVTLAALCNVFSLDIETEAKREVDRITQPDIVLKIRAKQAAKPTGSALPMAVSAIVGSAK